MSFKLNPEAKAKWVAALRSGKYKQGHGRLRDGDTFCCLGVAVQEGLCVVLKSSLTYASNYYIDNEWMPTHIQGQLISKNDGDDELVPETFAQIADYIEKNL